MQPGSSQFLVNFIHSLGPPQVFFGVWAFIVIGAVMAFYFQGKRQSRRNFREKRKSNSTTSHGKAVTIKKDSNDLQA